MQYRNFSNVKVFAFQPAIKATVNVSMINKDKIWSLFFNLFKSNPPTVSAIQLCAVEITNAESRVPRIATGFGEQFPQEKLCALGAKVKSLIPSLFKSIKKSAPQGLG